MYFYWDDLPGPRLNPECTDSTRALESAKALVNFPIMIPGRGWLGSGGGLPQAGISEATFYNWRKKYAGLLPSEMKRLRQLEEENSKLKRIVADLSLDKEMLQDAIRRKL